MQSHEVDYRIEGDDIQFVEVELDPQEVVMAEPGSMMYMKADIAMETVFGDGSHQADNSILGKMFSAGKRVLTGENLFMTAYKNQGRGKSHVAFAAPMPGKIIPIDLTQYGNKVICQKDSFLCAAKGVAIGIEFNRKIGVGLFGGEGFIMQKLEGDGMVFANAGGTIHQVELQHGEVIKIDTGCLVAFTSAVNYDIEMVKGIKNALFGGEGLFLATLRGPGTVWIQSLPFSRMADKIISSAPKMGGKSTGEGSILGGIGGMVMGNNNF
jgi:uncharacterized protein (TIGR00266 family)